MPITVKNASGQEVSADTLADRIPSIGAKTGAQSLPVARATDQGPSRASALFIRPANTTPYDVGDLVANHATAASVVPAPLTAARANGGSGVVSCVKLTKSGTGLAEAFFRVHLFSTLPVPSNGDNGAFVVPVAGYLGCADVLVDRAFSNGAIGTGVPADSQMRPRDIVFVAASGVATIWALVEARGAYVPISEESFTVEVEVRDRT